MPNNKQALDAAREHRRLLGLPPNCVTVLADAAGRDYIMPEDVSEALESNDVTRVRLDVLEVLGGMIGYGAEDSELCAYIAHQGG